MNILHLKYAVEVEKTGSITQAAEHLFMGQPNLSKAIRELENNLGITLFKRTSKGVVATQEGEVFLKYAKSIIAQVDAVETLYSPKRQNKLSYSFAVSHIDYAAQAFLNFAAEVSSDNAEAASGAKLHSEEIASKDISFEIRSADTLGIINLVDEGECRLGVIRYNLESEDYYRTLLRDKDLVSDHLIKFEYIVMMRSGHPLSGRSFVSADELSPYLELICGSTVSPAERAPTPSAGKNAPEIPEKADERPAKRRLCVSDFALCYDYLSRLPSAYTLTSPKTPDFLAEHGFIARPCRFEHNIFRDVIIYKSESRRGALDDRLIAEIHRARDIIRS